MNKETKIGLCILLILLPSVLALDISVDERGLNRFDLDGDGVCDWEKENSRYSSLSEQDLRDLENRVCILTLYGDVCSGTSEGARVNRERNGLTSGCSDEQAESRINYWSVDPSTKLSPDRVKMNWLLDQNGGFEIYKYVKLIPNIIVTSEQEDKPIVDRLTFNCRDVTEYSGNVRGYVANIRPTPDADDNKEDAHLEISFRQLKPGEVDAISILNEPGEVYRKAGDPSQTLRELTVDCEVTIHQHIDLEGGTRTGFYEKDEFTFFVPIEVLVVEPPEQALTYAITVADQLVDRSSNLLSIFDKARTVCGAGCVSSALFLLSSSVLRNIPGVNVIGQPLYEIAKKIWEGVGDKTFFSISGKGGWVGGKAFCRYYTCPASWCPIMQSTFHEEKNGDKSIFKPGEGINQMPLFSVFNNEDKYIQDNLILSVRCGCVTGVQQNLMYVNAIFSEFERCLKAARYNRQYTSVCEQYLRDNVCEFVLKQGKDYLTDELLRSALGKLNEGISAGIAKILPEKEALESENIRRGIETKFRTIREDYNSNGFEDITRAQVRGTMGYSRIPTDQLICETALYGKFPKLDLLTSLQEELGLPWKTNYHTSYTSEPAYYDEKGNPIYSLKISWFLLAGQDNFCYKLYLKDETTGATKDIPTPQTPGLETRSIQKKCLASAGNYNADYIELVDTREYDQICFHFDKEVPREQCFPKGTHSSALDLGNIKLNEDEDDSDGDGLPDYWEKRYNCLPEMASWNNENWNTKIQSDGINRQSCESLLSKGGLNRLNPSLKDSDGDGINDGKENPDNDAYNNGQEFDYKMDPNKAGEDAAGGGVLEKCNINFDSFTLMGMQSSLNNIPKFNLGSEIDLKVEGTVVSYKDGKELNPEDMAIEFEIRGPNDFYDPGGYVEWNAAKNGVKLLDITETMPTGNYKLSLKAIYEQGFSKSQCVNANKNYEIIKEDKNLIIINTKSAGCVDSDNGEKNIKGVCYDSTGQEKEDVCSTTNALQEYGCGADKKCTLLTGLSCSAGEKCVNGGCVSSCVENTALGSCAYTISKTKPDGTKEEKTEVKFAECDRNSVVSYKCESGGCVKSTVTKVDCGSNLMCYKQENKAAICILKCFDNDGGINENTFGAGIAYVQKTGGEWVISEFADECVEENEPRIHLAEKWCNNGEFDSRVITCSNFCVIDKTPLRYDALGINKQVNSAKCT